MMPKRAKENRAGGDKILGPSSHHITAADPDLALGGEKMVRHDKKSYKLDRHIDRGFEIKEAGRE